MMIVHGKVINKQSGIYTKYVIQKDDNSYLICTVLPNWDITLQVGDEGFFSYKDVHPGDTYIDKDGSTQMYKYINTYLEEFIRDKKQTTLKI